MNTPNPLEQLKNTLTTSQAGHSGAAPRKLAGEFRDFILSGNVMDMTIGVLVGSSFAKFSQFLTGDLISPLIAKGMNLLQSQAGQAGASVTGSAQQLVGAHYAKLFGQGLDMLIAVFSVFLLVQLTNRLRPARVEQQHQTDTCPFCLMEVPVQASRCGHCTSMLSPHHHPTEAIPAITGPLSA